MAKEKIAHIKLKRYICNDVSSKRAKIFYLLIQTKPVWALVVFAFWLLLLGTSTKSSTGFIIESKFDCAMTYPQQVANPANNSSCIRTHASMMQEAKLLSEVKNYFTDFEAHEVIATLNDTFRDAMDSSYWADYSPDGQKDRHLVISLLSQFISRIEVLNYKMRVV